ncbi:MAG TPA: Ig-like domain-containing protein [Methylibium sp.]|uniref:Ig-like domain-containing protein n=1 Tax=Methylibium sp. TaxID=2067992 RepID=UPI002DBA9549|nr:Ig-like domain-containing protein [Methylibium sp.]HEU4458945.1 Ig-like domain-containing protein [Methylibium sp.]
MKNMTVTFTRVNALIVAAALSACGGGGGDSLFVPTAGTAASAPPTAASGSTGGGGGAAGGGISTVSSGVPSQRSMSLSVEKYALNWGADGDTTTVTARVTDTAGNPVPNGTPVQFSTEGGQIQTSCALTGVIQGTTTISACSVTFATQNLRPQDGLVTVLAWLEGQEAYIDVNGNGAYDAGEPFYDAGRIFRDDNSNGSYESVIDELSVGGTVTSAPGLGSVACGVNVGTAAGSFTASSFGFLASNSSGFDLGTEPSSAASTCDGVWGRTLIRGSVVLPVSDPRNFFTVTAARDLEGRPFAIVSTDFSLGTRGVSRPTAAPTGTAVTVEGAPANCTVTISPPAVFSTAVGPTAHFLNAIGAGCSGGSVIVKAAFAGRESSVEVPL